MFKVIFVFLSLIIDVVIVCSGFGEYTVMWGSSHACVCVGKGKMVTSSKVGENSEVSVKHTAMCVQWNLNFG